MNNKKKNYYKQKNTNNHNYYKNNHNNNYQYYNKKNNQKEKTVLASNNTNEEIMIDDIILEDNVLVKKNDEIASMIEKAIVSSIEKNEEINNTINIDDAINEYHEEDKPKSIFKFTILGYLMGPLLLIMMVFGVTYAYFTYYKEGENQADLAAGEAYVKLNGNTQTLSLGKMYPKTIEEARNANDNYIDFTILGKNTSDISAITYAFTLANGADVNGKNRIDQQYLLFDLAQLDNENNETYLLDAVTLNEFNNVDLSSVNNIPINTTTEISRKYRLRMWISDALVISDTEPGGMSSTTFSNLFANVKISTSTNTTSKSLPLSVNANRSNVENGVSFIRTTISNNYELAEEGELLDTNDTIIYEVTNPDNLLYFQYVDSRGNEVTTNEESLNLTYLFNKNEKVDVKIFTKSKNDANVTTDVTFKVKKNGEVIKEYTQTVSVVGSNYCLNNGFTKLADCILVTENLSSNVNTAKSYIASKGEADVNHTAPTYQYIEEQTETAKANVYQGAVGYSKWYFTDTYTFNDTNGTFTLKNNDSTPISTQYELSSAYIGKYTCGTTNTNYSGCSTIYKVTGVHTDTRYIDGDKITYKIFGSLDSQVGLYAAPDDQGTSYVFRGNVSNNNVLFGGYYWKILRTNGDGSIRLIFNGASANATGNNTAIANNANGYGTTYAFNPVHGGPTYVGYMYNENATSWESNATTDYHWTEEAVYYWAAKTDFEELTDDYGTYWKLKSTANPIQRKLKEMTTDEFTNYGYTCKGTAATSTCRVLFHVHSRSGVTTSQSSYTTKSPNTTDKSVVDTNNKESNAKKQLEKWYAEKLATKTNNGKSVTAYIVDNTFCNDRSILNPYTKGSYTLNNSYNSGYLLTSHTYYAARTRLLDASQGNKSATLLCANNNDKFSKTSAYGNAKLSYPVGLITADEFALAGGKFNEKNERFYLRTNGYYWTMSPSNFNSTDAFALEFYVNPSGMMYGSNVSHSLGLRAVINLSSETLITQGDGTIDNPYELSI